MVVPAIRKRLCRAEMVVPAIRKGLNCTKTAIPVARNALHAKTELIADGRSRYSSCAACSLVSTFLMIFSITPFSSIKNVVRTVPM